MSEYLENLIECPWCGVNKKIPPYLYEKRTKGMPTAWVVMCSNCGAEPNYFANSKEEAIKVWNTRITPTPEKVKIPFEWQDLKAGGARAKVIGGWILNFWTHSELQVSESSVFISDPEHKWETE